MTTIEVISPELERIVSLDEEHEMLGEGFGPEESPEKDSRGLGGVSPCTEGPVWWEEGGFLLFSDITHNRRMKWAPSEGLSVYQEPTNFANGLTRDPQGRLVACEQSRRRVTRIEHDGSVTVIANKYRGTQLNRPNDVIVRSDGCVYFSDPGAPAPGFDLDHASFYMVTPDLGEIVNLLDFGSPNGLDLSPDESILYLVHSRARQVWGYDLSPNGSINRASGRVICQMKDSEGPGVFDGMKVDSEGNIYCAGPGGVWIYDPTGKHLGIIWIKEPWSIPIRTWEEQIANIGWGGSDWKTLFYCGICSMGRIQLKIPGIRIPRVPA